MAGVKGRSGKGKDKPWADALRIAVNEDGPDGRRKLRAMADKCVAAALNGDLQAIKEIGDRLDGRPAQESSVTIDDKRDALDWTREELVAFLRDEKDGGQGAATEDGRGREPDSVH